MERIAIIGIGFEGFRPSLPDLSTREMMFLASSRAYADAGIDPRKDVDSFICCTEDFWEGWSITDEMVPDQIGAAGRALCTVSHDSLNGIANAFMQINSGLADLVVVESHSKVGDVETKEEIENLALEPIYIRTSGITIDLLTALEMSYFTDKTGVSREDLDEVVIVEKEKALRNPVASYGAKIRKEDLEDYPYLCRPLKSYDKAGFADACIVAVLASERWIKKNKVEAVYIDGIGWSSSLPWYDGGNISSAEYVKQSYQLALKISRAKKNIADYDYVEADDCYSYKLFQHLFALGYSKREVFSSLKSGQLNESGGSIGCGNFIEANGLFRMLQVYLRLKNKGGRGAVISHRSNQTASGCVALLSS